MKRSFLFLLFLLTVAGSVQAQATLSMQGTIRNSTGSAVSDGTYSLTFKLYTVESGGTAVWTETQDNIKVVGGVYSALLGSTEPLNAAFNVPYFVGIAVDGGSELIPRFRLTSAPYALSLIGQSNTFPSAGAVGVGTASPVAGQNLHVHNADGSAQALISSASQDDHTALTLKSGDNWGTVSIEGVNGNFNLSGKKNINAYTADGTVTLFCNGQIRASTENDGFRVNGTLQATNSIYSTNGNFHSNTGVDLQLFRGADLHIKLRGDGWTEMAHGTIFGGQNNYYFPAPFYYTTNGPFLNPAAASNQGMAIIANANVSAPSFYTLSDRRIKRDLQLCSGKNDLATLMQLEVTNYRHVDTLAKGSGVVNGFIAQQVEKVFPQAVTNEKNSIPDIYAKPAALKVSGNEATFRMTSANNLVAGDKVNIIQDGGDRKVYEVISVEGSAFTVKDWNASFNQPEKVFVYGKEVNDFHVVDYGKIHTLNVSATQELARQVEQLQVENASLRREFDAMKRVNEAVNGRLAKLEVMLETGNSKR